MFSLHGLVKNPSHAVTLCLSSLRGSPSDRGNLSLTLGTLRFAQPTLFENTHEIFGLKFVPQQADLFCKQLRYFIPVFFIKHIGVMFLVPSA